MVDTRVTFNPACRISESLARRFFTPYRLLACDSVSVRLVPRRWVSRNATWVDLRVVNAMLLVSLVDDLSITVHDTIVKRTGIGFDAMPVMIRLKRGSEVSQIRKPQPSIYWSGTSGTLAVIGSFYACRLVSRKGSPKATEDGCSPEPPTRGQTINKSFRSTATAP